MSMENGCITKGAGYSCRHWNNLPQEDQLKIFAALDRLAKDNPNIANQLEKLADVRENRPGTWKAGLKFLKIE